MLITGFERATTSHIMRALAWDTLVDGVVCSDEGKEGRPAPDLIQRAMFMAEVKAAARVLVAGDTVADLQAAARAGAGWIVGVLSGAHNRAQLERHEHSVLLPSIAELPGWLAEQ
ncbi:MAG: HAD family hydrolase [Pseudomonas sp.]